MELNDLDKMSSLFSSAKQFRESLSSHKDAVKKSNGSVDKHGYTFRQGSSDRFVAASFKFYLEAYRGNYGSSSCYTDRVYTCDRGDLEAAFVRYINNNKQMFLDGVANELDLMAGELLASAQKEVDNLNNRLNTAKDYINTLQEKTND